jgi:hypothetical protein
VDYATRYPHHATSKELQKSPEDLLLEAGIELSVTIATEEIIELPANSSLQLLQEIPTKFLVR